MSKASHYVFLTLIVATSLLPLRAQQSAKRLILKDGSYQLATKWEIQGDRVHYYSAERYEWEDVPKSLIDWDATNKFNQQNPRGANPNASAADIQQADADEKAERAADEAKRPQVAPGLRLPDSGGVFLLDNYRNQPQLVEIVQNGGELNKQTGKNIVHAVINPIPTGSKESIELKGVHSQVQAHDERPAIFVDVVADETNDEGNKTSELNRPDRFKIVRVQLKKDSRVISNMKISLLGKVSSHEDIVPTTTEILNGGEWLKLTPSSPLAAGEYAVVEMLDPKTVNFYVWDFGVDPKAPPNASAWTPQRVKDKPVGADQTPVLGQRPK